MEKVTCPRCNGAGGWVGWPDFTCYLCRGQGFRLRSKASLKRAAAKAAAKIRADHCHQCDQDKTSDQWFTMLGQYTWCVECFKNFAAIKAAGEIRR